MVQGDMIGLLIGAVALGAVHGIEPGHGWPVAASYALDQTNKWLYGFAASLILGIGHLVSSIAMVAAFFYAKAYFSLTEVNEPIRLVGDAYIGGPVSLVAGFLLIALGIREYRHGHSHGTGDLSDGHGSEENHFHAHGSEGAHSHAHGSETHHSHTHASEDHHSHDERSDGHSHEHDHGKKGWLARLRGYLPFGGDHSHSHETPTVATDRGLFGIAWFAFLLGFAHEEEFEIIALCTGSNYCLELMSVYAFTVIVGIVGLTMLLIAGYHRYEERVEQYTPYLPVFSAVVLVVMGVGFVTGVF